MADTKLFRESSLKRLSSPEQLDRALYVTTSRWWLAVLALAVVMTAVAVWSVRGEVSSYVTAQGILLSSGGRIVDAVASGSGILARIHPAVGDAVEKGELVGETTNSEVSERYRSAADLVAQHTRTVETLKAALAAEDSLIRENVVQQHRRLNELERSIRQSMEAARENLESYRRLFEEGIATRTTVEASQQIFDEAQRDLFETLRRRDELNAREILRRNTNEARLAESRAHREEAKRRLNELETSLGAQRLVAPAAGRVTEIKATVGTVLGPGQPVISIETGTERIEMLIYIAPADGKRVTPGLPALVSPSTVRREEHGAVKGTVEHVSAFPASLEGILATLQNRNLAETISQGGAPYAGRITLVPDPSTASGFAWTSPKGSSRTLTSGTLATAEIKVETRAPIALVVPLVRETFGL